MSVKIVIDSASDISKNEADVLGVELVPMIVTFGTEEYYDGVELLPNQFYEKLVESDVIPKTGQISAYRFEEVFERVLNDFDEIVVITISSRLSATNNSAKQAAERFNSKVFVVDSMSAAIGERLLCEYALRLINKGLNAEQISDELENIKGRINVIAVLDTLEYLKKGGRISSTLALVGDALSIKPVLGIIDGEVKLIGKAMGSRRSNNLLNSRVSEKGGIDFSMPFGVIWSGFDKTVLDKYVKDSAHLWANEVSQVPYYQIGSTIGSHVGPGVVGVAFFEK